MVGGNWRRPATLALALACVAACATAAAFAVEGHAQPTFGRPKPSRQPDPTPDSPPGQPGDAPRPSRLPPEEDWRDGDPIRRAPFAQGTQPEPGVVFAWKTEDGTRFAWSLPYNFKRGEGYDIIVLLHPARADFRWGFTSHPRPPRSPTGFRPDDIVVSIDGLGGDARRPNQRLFEPSDDNMIRFRDIMLEVSRFFPANRLYLYGAGGSTEGGGGAFAVKFAGTFPALSDGVLVHGAVIPSELASKNTVPIVLMHGAKDSFVPLREAYKSLAAFKSEGHTGVRIRTLRAFNDFTNPVRAAECIDYLQGITGSEPAGVLAAAERMLTPRPADEYNYTAPCWFTGAYAVLERLTGSGKNAVADVPESVQTRARELQERIDAAAADHVKALTPLVGPGGAAGLALDGEPWLGYLLAFRDDFRAVPSAEQYIASIGLDSVLAEHAAQAQELLSLWESKSPKADKDAIETYQRVLDLLPNCYLYEPLPVDLTSWMRAVTRNADELGLDPAQAERYEYITLLDKGWRSGLDEYRLRWRLWSLPPPEPGPAKGADPGTKPE